MSYGIDKYITLAQQRLTEKLWVPFNNMFYGKSMIQKKSGNNQPYVYDSNGEYKEVFVDDNYDSIIHFYVFPDKRKISNTLYQSDVYIYFAVNLQTIYGGDDKEHAQFDAIKAIKSTAFQYRDIVDGIKAYNDFDLTEKQQHQFNMHPFYVFRIECICNYSLAPTICSYSEIHI